MSGFRRYPDSAQRIKREVRPWMRRVADDLANEIEAKVQATHTGYLKRGYTADVQSHGDTVRITIDSSFWHWIEYGNIKSQAHHPIGRTMVKPGIEWRDAK